MVYLLPPVCALIGWFTNWVAIRSLFRPRQPWRLFGKRVPLTPGLLIRKQDELAHSVGRLSSEEFLDGGRVSEYVLARMGLHDAKGFGATVARDLIEKGVEKLDLGELVADRIRSLEPADVETVVLRVMRRELRYIEVLGGVIGFAVGVVQMLLLL